MNTLIRAGIVALATFCSLAGSWAAKAQNAIPPSLRDWQGWVMKGEEFRRCPFASTADTEPGEPVSAEEFRCVWPERMTLAVDSRHRPPPPFTRGVVAAFVLFPLQPHRGSVK